MVAADSWRQSIWWQTILQLFLAAIIVDNYWRQLFAELLLITVLFGWAATRSLMIGGSFDDSGNLMAAIFRRRLFRRQLFGC